MAHDLSKGWSPGYTADMIQLPEIVTYPDPDPLSSDAACLAPVLLALEDPIRKQRLQALLAELGAALLLISPEYKPQRGAELIGGTVVYHFKAQPGKTLSYRQIGHAGTLLDDELGVIGYPDMLDQEALRQLRWRYDVPAHKEIYVAGP